MKDIDEKLMKEQFNRLKQFVENDVEQFDDQEVNNQKIEIKLERTASKKDLNNNEVVLDIKFQLSPNGLNESDSQRTDESDINETFKKTITYLPINHNENVDDIGDTIPDIQQYDDVKITELKPQPLQEAVMSEKELKTYEEETEIEENFRETTDVLESLEEVNDHKQDDAEISPEEEPEDEVKEQDQSNFYEKDTGDESIENIYAQTIEKIESSKQHDSPITIIKSLKENDKSDYIKEAYLDEEENDLQYDDSLKEIKFYWSYDSSCVFIATWNYDGITNIYSMDKANSKIISVLKLPINSQPNFILPCIHGIISVSSNNIYLTNYDNTQILLNQYNNNSTVSLTSDDANNIPLIKDIYLLNKNNLIVIFEQLFHIINLSTFEIIEKKFQSNKKLKFSFSNIPKSIVYSPEFDLIDTILVFIFDNGTIEIYKFAQDNERFNLLVETVINDEDDIIDENEYLVDDYRIDGIFSIENIISTNKIYSFNRRTSSSSSRQVTVTSKRKISNAKYNENSNNSSKLLIRFALWNRKKHLLKILNTSNNLQSTEIDTNIIEFKHSLFYRNWESSIADFYNDRILLNADGGVYLFDISKC